jgi:hypothetical protein
MGNIYINNHHANKDNHQMHRKHSKLPYHGGWSVRPDLLPGCRRSRCQGAQLLKTYWPQSSSMAMENHEFQASQDFDLGYSYSCSMKYQTEPSPTRNTLECHCLVGDLLLLFKNVKPRKSHQQMV